MDEEDASESGDSGRTGESKMRQYILTDRDFEDFYNTMVAAETQIRAEHNLYKDRVTIDKKQPWEVADGALRTMRYHFIGWRNRVMSGNIPCMPMDAPPLREPEWLKTRLKQLGLAEED